MNEERMVVWLVALCFLATLTFCGDPDLHDLLLDNLRECPEEVKDGG